jgi:hypothetical protein
MSEKGAETEKELTLESGMLVKKLCRAYNLAVLASILVLAVLLGVLNNLRVADERKVKWFGAPAARANQNAAGEVAP